MSGVRETAQGKAKDGVITEQGKRGAQGFSVTSSAGIKDRGG